MPSRQSLKAFQDSYAKLSAASATAPNAATSRIGSPSQSAQTPSGESASATTCQNVRRIKNEKRLARLVMACQCYALVALFFPNEFMAISVLCAAFLGVGLVAGAWVVDA